MQIRFMVAVIGLCALGACGAGQVGDECFDDGDCAGDLHCHIEEEEEETEEEEEEHEHAGVCEDHEDE